ncbi:MAG: glycosyltransferase family 2 protein [Bacteroidota bacterium]
MPHKQMKVSGFSFVRNAIAFDYPFLESIQSVLPLCDEFVIAVGKSDDATLERIESLRSPKIVTIPTVWDDNLRNGGVILAQQTNIALNHVSGDWAIYLQADEVVHEKDLPAIRKSMEEALEDKRVEGLLFSYKHFYGSYGYIGASRRWYRNEIRVVRPAIGVRSWGDAQGFPIAGRKMRVKLVDASIYHYGWVKSPARQQAKQRTFNRYWHDDSWMEQNVYTSSEFDYSSGGRLEQFTGTHPAVMKERVAGQDWYFSYDPAKMNQPLVERTLDRFESATGLRPWEYRNYKLL